jgi:hypothetical protein
VGIIDICGIVLIVLSLECFVELVECREFVGFIELVRNGIIDRRVVVLRGEWLPSIGEGG